MLCGGVETVFFCLCFQLKPLTSFFFPLKEDVLAYIGYLDILCGNLAYKYAETLSSRSLG